MFRKNPRCSLGNLAGIFLTLSFERKRAWYKNFKVWCVLCESEWHFPFHGNKNNRVLLLQVLWISIVPKTTTITWLTRPLLFYYYYQRTISCRFPKACQLCHPQENVQRNQAETVFQQFRKSKYSSEFSKSISNWFYWNFLSKNRFFLFSKITVNFSFCEIFSKSKVRKQENRIVETNCSKLF